MLIGSIYVHEPIHLDANAEGTVYFTSPLYRKNLHYKIMEKPSQADKQVEIMVEYILKNHRDHSGIIYCFKKAVSGPRSVEISDLTVVGNGGCC